MMTPDAEKTAVSTIAAALLSEEPAFVSALEFGPFVHQGVGAGPSLLIGDQSEISLLAGGGSQLDYRMALLAHPGDLVLVKKRTPAFESYLADHLGLGAVHFRQIGPADRLPVAAKAWQSPDLVEMLARCTRDNGGLTLKSYLTTGHIWRLAQAIGDAAQSVVHVCGPSSRATRRANDKLWFSRLARRVISGAATPPTRAAYGPAATAGLVRKISQTARQVIVKIPDSAGSTGNVRLDSDALCTMSVTRLRAFLLDRLHRTGWQDTYPVLVGVWDQNVLCSPSVQLWLPHPRDGAPRVDGVFEQHVKGEEGTFVGAARSDLPKALQRELAAQACQIAAVLQELGYFGRCSLDAVICTDPGAPAVIHWIECNGRWGGVSIPMTAAEQLCARPTVPALLIVQEKLPDRRLKTPEMIRLLNDLLYHHSSSQSGLIIVSPPEADTAAVINLMALAQTQRDADALMETAMARLDAR